MATSANFSHCAQGGGCQECTAKKGIINYYHLLSVHACATGTAMNTYSLKHHLIPHHFYSSEKSELSELMQSDQYVGKAPVLISMEVPRREGCNYPGWPQTSSLSFYAKAPAWWISELQVSVAGVQSRNGGGGNVPKRVFLAQCLFLALEDQGFWWKESYYSQNFTLVPYRACPMAMTKWRGK